LTVSTHKFRQAVTRVVGHAVDACAVVLAQVGLAVVPIDFTALAFKAVRTVANKSVQFVGTVGIVLARVRRAFVNVNVAVAAGPSGLTIAPIIADQVVASGGMNARIALAFVHFRLAAGTLESGEADARPAVDFVDASGAVEAGQRLAFVDVRFAVDAAETAQTLAGIAVDQVVTGGVVLTRCAVAFVDLNAGGRLTGKSGPADAAVTVDTVTANRVRGTSHVLAVISVDLATFAFESGRTDTLNASRSRSASCAIFARIALALNIASCHRNVHDPGRDLLLAECSAESSLTVT